MMMQCVLSARIRHTDSIGQKRIQKVLCGDEKSCVEEVTTVHILETINTSVAVAFDVQVHVACNRDR